MPHAIWHTGLPMTAFPLKQRNRGYSHVSSVNLNNVPHALMQDHLDSFSFSPTGLGTTYGGSYRMTHQYAAITGYQAP